MSLFHAQSIKYKRGQFPPKPRPHVSLFVWKPIFFFCPVWPSYRPHVFRENAHQSEDFWKRWLLVYLWPDKTEVFECDVYPFSSPEPLGLICNRPKPTPCLPTTWPRNDGLWGREWMCTAFATTITHAPWGMLSYFHCSAFSHGRAKVIRVSYVWTRISLKTEGKKYTFAKISGYVWSGPQSFLLLVFSVTPFKIDQNKNQNRSIDKGQNLGNERWYIYKDLRQDSGQRIISNTRYPKKCFTQTYGDAMLVLAWMSSNMADGNQQKQLLPSFATKAWIYSSKNS